MRGLVRNLVIVGIVILGLYSGAFAFSAADFLPPADGGSTEVVSSVVEGEDGILEAVTAQDGFNYASQKLRFLDVGFHQVSFGSGIGYIAGAKAHYEVFENPNATQQSLRLAYVQAYTMAKAELTRGLRGLSGRGKELLREQWEMIDTGSESSSNFSRQYLENEEQVVEGLLRGYVVYEVEHRKEEKAVYVSIATSPKSLSSISNVSGAVVQSASLQEGLDYVLKEISCGIIPPVGGKIVTVPDTGEVAVVSFGSDILRTHENATMARALQQASERAATMRANEAMISIIEGDNLIWRSGMSSSTEFALKEFEEVLNDDSSVHYERLGELRTEFLSTMQQSDDYYVFTNGNMPAGVSTRLATDEYWVYAINVYLPSVSQQAEDFYIRMQSVGGTETATEAVTDNREISKIYHGEGGTGAQIQQGPTGKVSSSDDL